MNAYLLTYYLFCGLIVMSAGAMLFLRNVLHAALALMGVLLGVAGMFVFAGAEFLAMTQLMIYAGGIIVLIIFGLMLSKRDANDGVPLTGKRAVMLGSLLGVVTCCSLIWLVNDHDFSAMEAGVFMAQSTADLGENLMLTYVLPFEVAGMLLLIALVAAVHISGKKEWNK